jgi:hypothetical protein
MLRPVATTKSSGPAEVTEATTVFTVLINLGNTVIMRNYRYLTAYSGTCRLYIRGSHVRRTALPGRLDKLESFKMAVSVAVRSIKQSLTRPQHQSCHISLCGYVFHN